MQIPPRHVYSKRDSGHVVAEGSKKRRERATMRTRDALRLEPRRMAAGHGGGGSFSKRTTMIVLILCPFCYLRFLLL